MRGSALDAVRARLAGFRAGDATAVLAPEAEQDAARAVEQPTPESVAAVAWLYQYRAAATDDLGGSDAQLAFRLFSKIANVLPGELPAHVEVMLRVAAAPEGEAARLQHLLTDAENALEDPATATDPVALDRWIDVLHAFGAAAAEHGRQHSLLDLLGRFLRRRFPCDPDEIWRLEQAADCLRTAAGAVPPRDLLAHLPAYNLCVTLLDHFEATGDTGKLREAAEASDLASRGISPAHAHYPRIVAQRADILCTRSGVDPAAGSLSEAAELCREALRHLRPDHPAAPFVHATAARVLGDQYVVNQDLALLREALVSAETALTGLSDDGERHLAHGRYGRLLILLGRRAGDVDALVRAEEALTFAAESLPHGHSLRAVHLSDLADAQFEHHLLTGDEALLRAARESALTSVEVLRSGDTANPPMLDTLARILIRCYEVQGDPRELDTAVEWFRNAEELCPPDSRSRALALLHLGHALMLRAAVLGDVGARDAAFDEAEQTAELAVEACPSGPDRLTALNNAAAVARRRSEGDPAVVRRAGGMYREILRTGDPGSVPVRLATFNLGSTLLDLFEIERDPALLDEAEPLLRTAAGAAPPGQHHHATATAALARCVALRAGAPTDEAVELLRSSIAAGGRTTSADRVSAAVTLGRLYADAGQWRPARDAFAEAIDLLAARLADRESAVREHGVASFFGLASRAAACALAAGDPVAAVTLLERGRGLLTPTAAAPSADACLDTAGRTVAMLNVSRYRCDALLVRDGQVTVLPLPGVTHDAVNRQAGTFLWGAQRGADPLCPPEERSKGTRVAVNGALRWLWHTTVRPVLDAVRPDGSHELPRIWWCPTGMLAFVPLHAAGEYGSLYGGSGGECAADRVVSSYTTTLRALRHAAHGGPGVLVPSPGSPLVVAPQTPDLPELPQAREESDALRRLYPGCTDLIGPKATKSRILAELPRHSWFHFAGHGSQNAQVVRSAHLVPHDHALHGGIGADTLRALNLEHAELAFLSACNTATGQLTLADDQAHVAGMLLGSGFRHVVAAQWTVRDGVAAQVATAFHRRVAAAPAGGVAPAVALHQAVREVRRTHPEPHLWAPFMHYGP
ncbi:tetratricopeptide (TPR) repeat protein [Streptomyces sp. 3330]|uniref:CHAT domain-containing protein n=1 Tax=Streptomyces sp. 3330 TaxID=2817755 RepID=UPI002863F60C|nr:CHAT domain-containing protein [Streptomyces sp. 3330]MDR6974084.1 tetratricopeptide (TPR) repeat protein [Streptomyces sp. 3330]